jgi:hypothetical protein
MIDMTWCRNRIVPTWLLLVAATLLSVELFARIGQDPRLPTMAVMLVAAIKARLIGLDFMELRHAPIPLRLAFEAWLLGLTSILMGLYWMQAG